MNTSYCKMVSAVGITMLALSAGLAGQANAVCNQANLAGTWYMFSSNSGMGGHHYEMHNSGMYDESHGASVRCKVRLASTGAVVANGSSCVTRDGMHRATVAVVGGTMHVSSTCAVSGNLAYAGTGRHTIEFGQMDRTAHNMFSFTLYQNSNSGYMGVLTAVKQ